MRRLQAKRNFARIDGAMATAGHAVWKVVHPNKVHYTNSHVGFIQYFYRSMHKEFKLYLRTTNGWKYITEHLPADKCKCGRAYDYSFDGEDCRRLENHTIPANSVENIASIMQLPILCHICYYKREYEQGQWCPRWVKEQLGIAT